MNEKNNREKNNREKNNRKKDNQVGGQNNRMNANNNKAKNKGVIKRLWKYASKFRAAFVVSLVASAVYVAFSLILPIIFGKATDLIVGEGNVSFSELITLLIYALCAAAGAGISQWITEILCNKISNGITAKIRDDTFGKLQKVPLKYLDGRSTGDVLSVEIGDADKLSDGLLLGFSRFFTGIITIIGTLAFMFAINPVIALVVAGLTPISLLTAKFITGRTYGLFKAQSRLTGEQTALVEETLSNLPTVKAYATEEVNGKKFDDINEELKTTSFKALFFSSLTNPSTRLINAVVYAAVALTGALLAVNVPQGAFLAVTAGEILSLLSYANRYTKPFNEITSVMTELTGAKACAARLFEILDEAEEVRSPLEKPVSGLSGNVDIDDVNFSYVPDKKLIENFNLSVKSGTKVAIVGPTGCGKTTLINLLMRFYDVNSGEIRYDDTPITEIERRSLRLNIGMVLQETWIRKASVYDNVRIGRKDATREEVIDACKLANAHGFITRLDGGYDAIIGEDGLSAGQKQLLCIARVMLCLPPMLILDEATSSIDTRTEMKIQRAFDTLTAGKTSFIVAHRLSTIKSADAILVMKDGNVIEQGTHAELLEKHGFYYDLYNSQYAAVSAREA